MWLFTARISQRWLGHVAEVLPLQNQARLHRASGSVSEMQHSIRTTNHNKTAASHQDSWGKSLLEMKKHLGDNLGVEQKLQKVSELIKDYEEKMEELRLLKLDLENELKVYETREDLVERWTSTEFPWSDDVLSKSREVFEIDEPNVMQLKSINATMCNKDILVILPTGGGKSLCYQLPALLSQGITLVVSPLLSLMEDQVMSMKKLGVNAEMLCSTSSVETALRVYDTMEADVCDLKLLYITPEKISKSNKFFAQLHKCYRKGNLSRIAIDEVHCVQQWGNTFRPDYKILCMLKQTFSDVPLLGLTATATTQDTEQMKKMLHIPDALVFHSPVIRNNLFYEVRKKPDTHDEVMFDMAETIRRNFQGKSGLVYCHSRKDCERVRNSLIERGITTECYHSGMSPLHKSSVHIQWLRDELQVICCTTAFGMGINKPDVRFVIHHTMSKSIDDYYQESGRAGRDNLPSLCLLYFGFRDISRLNNLVIREPFGLKKFSKVLSYCSSTRKCRHKVIADVFGTDLKKCNQMCDSCNGIYDFNDCDVTKTSRVLMNIVQSCVTKGERLTGSVLVKRATKETKKHDKSEIETILMHLITNGYFREEYVLYPFFNVTYIVLGPKARLLNHSRIRINLPQPKNNRRYRTYQLLMKKCSAADV